MRYVLAALLIALPAAAFAQGAPRSIEDCERIKVDLAYNQCLASFGPKMGERAPGGGPVAEDYSGEETRQAVRSSRRGRAAYQRGRRGRKAASFSVVSRGKAQYQTRYTKRRRR
jgi:hypothetical protein